MVEKKKEMLWELMDFQFEASADAKIMSLHHRSSDTKEATAFSVITSCFIHEPKTWN